MKVLDTTMYLDTVCRMLAQGQENVPVPIRGDSMRPFLRNADFTFLCPLPERVRPGDMVLFQRENGQYILHRVYRVLPGERYLLLGDAELTPEPVQRSQLRGKVSYVRCAGQILKPGDFRWWFFEKPWRWLGPRRKLFCALRERFRK